MQLDETQTTVSRQQEQPINVTLFKDALPKEKSSFFRRPYKTSKNLKRSRRLYVIRLSLLSFCLYYILLHPGKAQNVPINC